jgi:hypothetical protein
MWLHPYMTLDDVPLTLPPEDFIPLFENLLNPMLGKL